MKPLTLMLWQQLCDKTNIPAEVAVGDFINVDSDIVVLEVTKGNIIQEAVEEQGRHEDANNDGDDGYVMRLVGGEQEMQFAKKNDENMLRVCKEMWQCWD